MTHLLLPLLVLLGFGAFLLWIKFAVDVGVKKDSPLLTIFLAMGVPLAVLVFALTFVK